MFLKSKNGLDVVFVTIMLVVGFSYSYVQLIGSNMLGAHIWRQADCLSITLNYFQHGMNFLTPEIHNQISDGGLSGKSIGEFPILYYFNALIWKITGPTTVTYRILSLLITFGGLFSFYRIILRIFNNQWLAFVLPILMFTSPVYAIYGIGFLTDVPAFSISLMAWLAITVYFRKGNHKYLWISMALFALAGLIKVSSLIGFLFLGLVFIAEALGFPSWKGKYLFKKNPESWLAFIMVLLIVFLWYFYAEWYNGIHQGKYTFNHIYTYFELPLTMQKAFLGKLRDDVIYVFYSKSVLFLMLFVWISNFFLLKRMPLIAALATIFIPLGVLVYVLLWSGAFSNHDYYYVPLLQLFPAIFIPFLLSISTINSASFSRPAAVLLVVFTIYNIFYCGSFVFMRHFGNKGEFVMAGSSESVFANKWIVNDFEKHWKPFDGIETFLNRTGIEAEHKIICPTDVTINGSLYLMNRRGWTGFQQLKTVDEIQKKIGLGASWLVMHDFEQANQEAYSAFMHHPVASYNGLLFFDLRPYQNLK